MYQALFSILNRLFQLRNVIPTLESKLRNVWGEKYPFLHCGDVLALVNPETSSLHWKLGLPKA